VSEAVKHGDEIHKKKAMLMVSCIIQTAQD